MRDYASILSIYSASDGDATKALYADLEARGAIGIVGLNLFRALKTSSRAKQYRRGAHVRSAYDHKTWSLGLLCAALKDNGEGLGLRWGWRIDPRQEVHKQVLHVDLPTGQVSFHSATREADCPDYPGDWDGVRDEGPTRICRFVAAIFAGEGGEVCAS